MTEEIKAKRKLKGIDFSSQDSHIALVHKDQGGPANGADYKLVLKAVNKLKDDFIKKASNVKVTLPIEEFLSTFYGLYYEQSETLARALGFTTAAQEESESKEVEDYEDWYENYINTKVQSIEVMKSLYQAENVADVLAELDGPQYLGLMQDQQMLEKSFRKIERINKAKESKPTGDDTSKSEVKEGKSPVIKNKTKETNMDEIVELQKSLADNQLMLTKALEQVKALESEKKEQVIKSKTAKITELVKDETHAKIIAKACLELESEEDFTAFVAAIQAMTSTIDKTDMFIEKGLQVDNIELQPTESAVMKAVKARIAKAAK